MNGLNLLLIALVAYLVASFPTAVVVSRLRYRTDIREHGSGNPGAANVLRTLGWKPAAAVLVVDVAKGFLPALLAPQFQFGEPTLPPDLVSLLAGAAATVGHCYPLYTRFWGGKGVATLTGALLAVYPVAVPICLAVFITVAASSRYASLSSLAGVLSMPVVLLVLRHRFGLAATDAGILGTGLLAGFIVFTHRGNIARLLGGTEPRLPRETP